jgi:hypothetical protein
MDYTAQGHTVGLARRMEAPVEAQGLLECVGRSAGSQVTEKERPHRDA